MEMFIEKARAGTVGDAAKDLGFKIKNCRYSDPCPSCGGHDRFPISLQKRTFNCRLQRCAALCNICMRYRFDRELACELGLWQAINRLANNFRNEDKSNRACRRSNSRTVLEKRPYLKAQITQVRGGDEKFNVRRQTSFCQSNP